MRFRLRAPRFLRNIVSDYISKLMSEESGYDMYIQINEMEVGMHRKRVYAHMNVDADIDRKDLMRVIKESRKG